MLGTALENSPTTLWLPQCVDDNKGPLYIPPSLWKHRQQVILHISVDMCKTNINVFRHIFNLKLKRTDTLLKLIIFSIDNTLVSVARLPCIIHELVLRYSHIFNVSIIDCLHS